VEQVQDTVSVFGSRALDQQKERVEQDRSQAVREEARLSSEAIEAVHAAAAIRQAQEAEAERQRNIKRVELAIAAQKVRDERAAQKQLEAAEAKEREEAEAHALAMFNASVPVGVTGMDMALAQLRQHVDPKQFKKALETLSLLLRNIVGSPENPIFRHIKTSNAHIEADLGQFPGGYACLISTGFLLMVQEGEKVFVMEEPDLASDLDAWSVWFDQLKQLRDHIDRLRVNTNL
jgi:hypothetical protein